MDSITVVFLQILLFWAVYYEIAKPRISLWASIIAFTYFSIIFWFLGIVGVIFIFPFFYFFTLVTQNTKRKQLALFYSLYTTFISLVLTNFVALSSTEFISKESTEKYLFVLAIISIVLPILIHFLALRFFKIDTTILKEEDEFVKKEIIRPLNFTLLVCFTILLAIYGFEVYFENSPVAEFSKYLIFILMFMFFSIIGFLSNKTRAYLQHQIYKSNEKQLQQLDLYTREIESMYQALRGFRHDYTNMLISLKESIDSGEISQVKDVYDDILVSANLRMVNQAENTNINELSNIKNSALKSVLFWKITEVREHGVAINVEIKEPIDDLKMDILDAIRMISILIDNAIEEAKQTPKPTIELAFVKEVDSIIVMVRNSKTSKDIPIGRLFEAGFSTKGSNQGMGLFNVKEILSAYNYVDIDTEILDDSFTQMIRIRGNDE